MAKIVALVAALMFPALALAGEFVTNPTTTFPVKSDGQACTNPDPNKCMMATDYNAHSIALYDLRTPLLGLLNAPVATLAPDATLTNETEIPICTVPGQTVRRDATGFYCYPRAGDPKPIAYVTPPSSSSSPCVQGEIAFDASYQYSCIATNTWRRAAHDTWLTNPVAPAYVAAFPGAMGAGASSTGGRGGAVVMVTNLNDSGVGSLRECLAMTGARTCVFRVGGTINLLSELIVSKGDVTVAGQTAPGGGIQINCKNNGGGCIGVYARNVTWQYTRIREGRGVAYPAQLGTCTFASEEANAVIFDHNSLYWTEDDCVSAWADNTAAPFQHNLTWSNNIIAEPLADHPLSILTGASTRAGADNLTDIDFHHNYVVNFGGRAPLAKNKSGSWVNNVVYNWNQYATQLGGGAQFDIVGNVYRSGPLTPSGLHEIQVFPTETGNLTMSNGNPSLYVTDNIGPNDPSAANNWANMVRLVSGEGGPEVGTLNTAYQRAAPRAQSGGISITPESSATLVSSLMSHVGASRTLACAGGWVAARDTADTRVVNDYTNLTGGIPNDETEVGGFPVIAGGTACTDGDLDGLPFEWEAANGLSDSNPADRNTMSYGYTALEYYLAGYETMPEPEPGNLVLAAFPGAQGGGSASVGGRGGVVMLVTNTNDSGAGSLRACATASGPRTCVFTTGGTISLLSSIVVYNPYMTIAGQTAPGGGVQIRGTDIGSILFNIQTHDVTIRYVKFRKGYNSTTPEQSGDTASVRYAGHTVIFDHCEFWWSQDENIGLSGDPYPDNITVSYSIIAQPLEDHPTAILVGSGPLNDIDFHHNLVATGNHRMPQIGASSLRWVNNIVYNWNYFAMWVPGASVPMQMDFVGNYFKCGPLACGGTDRKHEFLIGHTFEGTSYYVEDNVGPNNPTGALDDWASMVRQTTAGGSAAIGLLNSSFRRVSPMPPSTGRPAITPHAVSYVMATDGTGMVENVGTHQRLNCDGTWTTNRDTLTTAIINDFKNGTSMCGGPTGTYTCPTTEVEVGGFPVLAAGTACLDGDSDGMPDAWETANVGKGLSIANAADRNYVFNGYTALEYYLAGYPLIPEQ